MRCTDGQREALHELQRFRRLRWALILGPFTVTAAMAIALRSPADVVLHACRDSFLLITFVSAIFSLLGYPVCPRCRRSFEAKHWGRQSAHTAFNPFTQRCLRCGLRLPVRSVPRDVPGQVDDGQREAALVIAEA